MDSLSFMEAIDAEIGCTGVVDVFEAPTSGTKSDAFGLHHHTIFNVDTTLTRETRNRKPSLRMAEYKNNTHEQKAVGGLHLDAACRVVDSNHPLWCDEDTSFMFSPQRLEQPDMDEATYSELQLICDSSMPMSC